MWWGNVCGAVIQQRSTRLLTSFSEPGLLAVQIWRRQKCSKGSKTADGSLCRVDCHHAPPSNVHGRRAGWTPFIPALIIMSSSCIRRRVQGYGLMLRFEMPMKKEKKKLNVLSAYVKFFPFLFKIRRDYYPAKPFIAELQSTGWCSSSECKKRINQSISWNLT